MTTFRHMKTRRLLLLLSLVFALDVMGASKFSIPASDKGLPGQGPIRRYDWFQKLWERKRSRWAERTQTDQGALVFLGDSITQGGVINSADISKGASGQSRHRWRHYARCTIRLKELCSR